MENRIQIVTDRAALREAPRRDRRRAKGAEFTLVATGRKDAPAEEARASDDARATTHAPGEDEVGSHLDVLG